MAIYYVTWKIVPKQIGSMSLCFHTVIDHRRHQKCGKRISDTLSCTSCATFLFLPHYDLICDLLLDTDIWEHGIYLLNLPLFLKNFF